MTYHPEEVRESILAAAMKLFRVQGYDGTGLEDICKAAGITKGAIYHHFENKLDILESVASFYLSAERRGWQTFHESVSSLAPAEKLERCLETLINHASEASTYDPVAIQLSAFSMRPEGDEIRAAFMKIYDERLKEFSKLLRAVQPDCDAENLAAFALSTIQGASLFKVSARDESRFQKIAALLKETVLNLLAVKMGLSLQP